MTVKELKQCLDNYDDNAIVALHISNILTSSDTRYFHTSGTADMEYIYYSSEYDNKVVLFGKGE